MKVRERERKRERERERERGEWGDIKEGDSALQHDFSRDCIHGAW